MKSRRGVQLVLLTGACVAGASCAQTSKNRAPTRYVGSPGVPRARLYGGIGYRGYDKAWAPFDDQFAFQLTGQHQWPEFPVGLEYGLGFASDWERVGGQNLLNSSVDLSVGPSKTLPLGGDGRLFLNLGGGVQVSFVREDQPFPAYSTTSDEWFGGYVHANLFWRAGWNWDFGLDLRWVKGEDVDLPGGPLEGQYFQLLFGTGFAW